MALGRLQLAPWETPLQPPHPGPLNTPCEVVGIVRGGTGVQGGTVELAGMRQNLQLLFLVPAAVAGVVGEGSVDESSILHGF